MRSWVTYARTGHGFLRFKGQGRVGASPTPKLRAWARAHSEDPLAKEFLQTFRRRSKERSEMAWTRKVTTKGGEPRYRVFWRSPDGVQHSETFMKFEDARRRERTVEVSKDRGEYQDPAGGKIKLAYLVERFTRSTKSSLNASRMHHATRRRMTLHDTYVIRGSTLTSTYERNRWW